MSSIIDQSRYHSRSRPAEASNSATPDDQSNRKPFHSFFSANSFKVFDNNEKLAKFSDGPLAHEFSGVQILCSDKTETIYTASNTIFSYRDDGFCNSFDCIEDAVAGKLSKSVDCYCGTFFNGHLIAADIGVKLIGVYDMGLAVISDFNLNPIKKTPFSEFGPPTDSAINCDESSMVISNQDHSVTTLELKNFSLADRFHSASSFTPTGIDFSPKDKHIFITCSKGFTDDCNYVSLWDTRASKSGSVHTTLNQPANCLKWSKRDSNMVSIATIDGFLHVIDTRNTHGEVQSMKIDTENPITRMKLIGDKLIGFNNTNNVVKIDEIENEFTLIKTGLSCDLSVRDLVQHKSDFYAIGHDSIFPRPINITL